MGVDLSSVALLDFCSVRTESGKLMGKPCGQECQCGQQYATY